MANTLMLYSSREGQTLKVLNRIKQMVDGECDLVDIHKSPEPDFSAYDKILVGASIRYGNFHKSLIPFLDKYKAQIDEKPNAFFLICLTARKPEKSSPATSRYMIKFDQMCSWHPRLKGVFAGALLYSRYNWWQTLIIQLIMKITGGSTDKSKDIEFTDWQKVDTFARDFSCL